MLKRFLEMLTRRPTRPQIREFVMPSAAVHQEIGYLGIKLLYPVLLDENQLYHYCDLSSWEKVIKYINQAFKFPDYVPARNDCDDFAILFKGLVSACFGLNACAIAIGTSPVGGHAFIMVRTNDGWYIIEPQNGATAALWPLVGSHGYTPTHILL